VNCPPPYPQLLHARLVYTDLITACTALWTFTDAPREISEEFISFREERI